MSPLHTCAVLAHRPSLPLACVVLREARAALALQTADTLKRSLLAANDPLVAGVRHMQRLPAEDSLRLLDTEVTHGRVRYLPPPPTHTPGVVRRSTCRSS